MIRLCVLLNSFFHWTDTYKAPVLAGYNGESPAQLQKAHLSLALIPFSRIPTPCFKIHQHWDQQNNVKKGK